MHRKSLRSSTVFGAVLRCAGILAVGLTTYGSEAQKAGALADLETHVELGRGQLQVGGPFAGAEFHHGRPLPSRVSFFYPVANSLDLSTDYWKRDESMPFSIAVTVDGKELSLGEEAFSYRATPASAVFEKDVRSHETTIAYRFAETLPLMVIEISLRNTASDTVEFLMETRMRPTLRTSHAYDFKDPTRTEYEADGDVFRADYEDLYTDSTSLFIVNAAEHARRRASAEAGHAGDQDARFSYGARLAPGETLKVVQLIGSCRQREVGECIEQARGRWREDVEAYEARVADYALREHHFAIDDTVLSRTARWSRAILAANMHYLDGHLVPMPTPAQYNFFFTHDLLLTDLGAVMFDPDRVARDLGYLARLAGPDSLLPHAYYWRNGEYVTEHAGSDNWNHLWFILLAGSYLKHSGDHDTVEGLLPMLRESMRLMRTNMRDGLMYSERPDWWDIGHVYGARSYLTVLMIRALRTYAYLTREFEADPDSIASYLDLAEEMRKQLVTHLWDDRAGYLLNMIDSSEVDRHYYSGSLLASAFELLDERRNETLLQSARDVLLDEEIGIRNAMPPDFLDHIERYRFNGPEVGAPYRYMNGGVWPQGIAWYALALLASGRPDSAKDVLERYLTLDGIGASPNGQPALFEYRSADPAAKDYGRIDKTTFLWAGGWYLNVLYRLAGVRENEWNLWFDSRLPTGFENLSYELMAHGTRASVSWTGEGPLFKRITVDGRRAYSAVLIDPAEQIAFERGFPVSPYLARVSASVTRVEYDSSAAILTATIRGVRRQTVRAEFVSGTAPRGVEVDGLALPGRYDVRQESDAFITTVTWKMDLPVSIVRVQL